MKLLITIFNKTAGRMVAVFILSALKVVGAGSILGVSALTTACLAGILGIAEVVEDLAKSYLQDGKLTDSEIDQAFEKSYDKNSEN